MGIHIILDDFTNVERKPKFVNRVPTINVGWIADEFGILTHQKSHRHKICPIAVFLACYMCAYLAVRINIVITNNKHILGNSPSSLWLYLNRLVFVHLGV